MNNISQILLSTAHRPYPLPAGSWAYYQEWNQALFLHYKVPAEVVRTSIPAALELDTFDGQTWVSLVAFTMEKVRPKQLPAWRMVSNFHEINLRAYVVRDNKPGVYFLSMEGQKQLSVWIAKILSGLPYEKADMQRSRESDLYSYNSGNKVKDFSFDASYTIDDGSYQKTALDKWLTERYCVFNVKHHKLFCYDVHHKEWPIGKVNITQLKVRYKAGELVIMDQQPDLVHYSPGVQVVAWPRESLIMMTKKNLQ